MDTTDVSIMMQLHVTDHDRSVTLTHINSAAMGITGALATH